MHYISHVIYVQLNKPINTVFQKIVNLTLAQLPLATQ